MTPIFELLPATPVDRTNQHKGIAASSVLVAHYVSLSFGNSRLVLLTACVSTLNARASLFLEVCLT
jgi:hypothetical protein